MRRWLAGGVIVALGMYARGGFAQTLPANVQVQKDVSYADAEAGAGRLLLDVYKPGSTADASGRGAVIMRLGAMRESPNAAATELLSKGYTLVYAAYLPAESQGKKFGTYPNDVYAAKAAVRWVRGNAAALGVDKDRIALWGAGPGATVAALVGVTPDISELNGKLGEYVSESSGVRALCLFQGVTDWRNAELYGDEMVNMPGTQAYQLFGGNPKEHPDEARQASAVNYVRPTSPSTLMVTLASDEQRAMHLIFAETMRKAGVKSALYEVPPSVGREVDETRLNRTVTEFFADVLKPGAAAGGAMTLEEEVAKLTTAGLFKQARRLIEQKIIAPGQITGSQRAPWLKKLAEINSKQQAPALLQLQAARKAGAGTGGGPLTPDAALGNAANQRLLWTIREVLTDPEKIGQYAVESSVPQRVFEARADAMKFAETLNAYILKDDIAGAERHANVMRDIARKADADPVILNEVLGRYDAIRGKTSRVWPAGVRGAPYAANYGQDLYGFWMDVQIGGVTQRMRYVPPGRFAMGSGREEWSRLPGEPILEPVQMSRGYWLADSEVTQGMYEGVMGGAAANPAHFKGTAGSAGAEARVKLPVEFVSYAHAVNFLNKLNIGARLPTESEWEYACRAGSSSMYSGTGRLSDMAWFWDEARNAQLSPTPTSEQEITILFELETDRRELTRLTHPVKQKLPNKWGLYDMQGNVWEWCARGGPGTAVTSGGVEKPRDYSPVRGGSWISIPQSCRAARAVWLPVEQQAWNVGFRICIGAE